MGEKENQLKDKIHAESPEIKTEYIARGKIKNKIK